MKKSAGIMLAFVRGYVLASSIRSQVDDGRARVYHLSESWIGIAIIARLLSAGSGARPAEQKRVACSAGG